MSNTKVLVVCVFAGAIILGATTTKADPGQGLAARVSSLEANLTDLKATVSDLESAVTDLADALETHRHDAEYVLSPAEDLSVVRGVVLLNGRILHGDGFTVTDEGDGDYHVAFDSGTFSNVPLIVVQALGSAPEISSLALPVTASSFGVTTSTGTRQGFKFIAIGPQ